MSKPTTPISRSHRRYGWQPDLPDHRDHLYSAIKSPSRHLPASIDLRSGCSPVEDQGDLGSCTANALVGVLEFLELKAGQPLNDLSRLFVYYNERAIEGTTSADSGALLRDGIKSLAKQGACAESLWPYQVADFANQPATDCYQDALQHTIRNYHRLHTVDEMRACLAEGFPFVFGFTVYESFESDAVAQTGVLNLPGPTEAMVGGHAVLAVGYDDAARRFQVRNSWGAAWGQAGYFTIPYEYLANRHLSDDFWTVRA